MPSQSPLTHFSFILHCFPQLPQFSQLVVLSLTSQPLDHEASQFNAGNWHPQSLGQLCWLSPLVHFPSPHEDGLHAGVFTYWQRRGQEPPKKTLKGRRIGRSCTAHRCCTCPESHQDSCKAGFYTCQPRTHVLTANDKIYIQVLITN